MDDTAFATMDAELFLQLFSVGVVISFEDEADKENE
jgi:hypothetical protein